MTTDIKEHSRNTDGLIPWVPGQSGNPAGRPKHSVTTLLKNTDELTTKQICAKLIDLAKGGDLPAIREYLDRTDGKVTEKIEVEKRSVSIVFIREERDG